MDDASRGSQIVRRATVADAILTEARFAPRTCLHEHEHPDPFFCLALHGPFTETTRGRTHERRSGDVRFHPPGETHEDRFHAAGGACFNIEFGPGWTERLREPMQRLGDARSAHTPSAWYARRVLDHLRDHTPPSPLVVEGLCLLLLADASRAFERLDRGHAPRWLAGVRSYLHDSLRSKPSIGMAAQVAGVHPVHLARVFRRVEGCSIGAYVRRLRVSRALELLAASDRSLVEIALESGFADQSHMTRDVRRACGLTPGAIRRRAVTLVPFNDALPPFKTGRRPTPIIQDLWSEDD